MKELEKLVEMRNKITRLEERLQNLNFRNTAPKNQILSAMPKGGNGGNGFDDYLIKKEQLENKLSCSYILIKRLWNLIHRKFQRAELTSTEIDLMKYRFYYNYSWKTCKRKMQKKHKDIKWTENRVFATYRVIKSKLKKVC